VKSLGLLALVAGVLVATAIASPWVAWGLGPRFTYARVFDRVFEASLLIAVVLAWRALDLGDGASIGFRSRDAARDVGRGFLFGLAGLAVGLGLCALCGALDPALRFGGAKTVGKAILGVAAALAIGVGEETLFRGVLLRRLRCDLGRWAGIVITTLLYAAVHVMRRRGSGGALHAGSGFDQLAGLLAPFADGTVLPQLVGLALLGAVLAAARLRSGALWLPIGVHAAYVAAFRVGRLFFRFAPAPWLVGAGWPPLVGGFAGMVAITVTGGFVLRHTRWRTFQLDNAPGSGALLASR
jgi:membrane protease YdiL (CAAX protease family)